MTIKQLKTAYTNAETVMVDLMQPHPGEVIQDPAAGTGGFLIAADT